MLAKSLHRNLRTIQTQRSQRIAQRTFRLLRHGSEYIQDSLWLSIFPLTRRSKAVFFVLWSLISMLSSPAVAQMNGRDIMMMVENRDDGEDMTATLTMRLINKNGKERVRTVRTFRKNYGLDTKSIIFFLRPADVKGTGFLSWNYDDPDKNDDQWLYLPALRKVRRILSSRRSDYFMGTDFTYDDMGERQVDEDTHTLLGSEALGKYDCYVVESIPRDPGYIYQKKITWIRKNIWIPLQVEFYDDEGDFLKRLTFSEIVQIDGIWTAKKLVMENVQRKHRTELFFEEVTYNTGLRDDLFTERRLKRGLSGIR